MTQKFSATCHLFWLYILLLLSSGQNSNCDNCDCLTGDLVAFEAYPVYECEGPSMLYIPNVLLICLYFCQLYLQWPAPRLSKWTVKTTQQRQNTESQFWKLHSAVGPLCSYLQCNVFPRHFLQNCYILFFVFDKIDLNTSVFVLCSLVKVQVSGERLDSLEMPGHQVMFRFLPKFQKFISGELNIKYFNASFRELLLVYIKSCDETWFETERCQNWFTLVHRVNIFRDQWFRNFFTGSVRGCS